ncbi:hypothetical protein HQQ80_17710 [Microbacteriaceae bacterium VKM Ac-2855]|nr:hypothetical protein [Microbacteriaceae bacterium VKM Ac-2855]
MGILDTFDPRRDGWSFQNFTTTDLSWDVYRRSYLAINPSKSAASPLDLAFYEIFTGCAKHGNCGGMSVLALTLFRFGGYLGYGSPAYFYGGGSDLRGVKGPARADLAEALNIMQARQFSATGIRNFVDVVKAGQLNDAVAAYARIESGLASGDYHVLSLANSLFGEAAHTVIPYRAEIVAGVRRLWLWDPNRPYDDFPKHYDQAKNRIDITGPTAWSYDQNAAGYSGGRVYQGSNAGWCFAIPTSLIRHKARQPISVGFDLTNAFNLLFVSNTGAVTQIEDDDGRRLFAGPDTGAPEPDRGRRIEGVYPWPRSGAGSRASDGELFILERPPDSAPVTLTVRGADYRLRHLGGDRLIDIAARGADGQDSIRLEATRTSPVVEVRTSADERHFDVQHVRADGPHRWEGVKVRDVSVTDDALRVHISHSDVGIGSVEVSSGHERRGIGVEFERFHEDRLTVAALRHQRIAVDGVLRARPARFVAQERDADGATDEVEPTVVRF